ncbi:MAG: SIR2 family protein [Bryobacteraceae bacterium]
MILFTGAGFSVDAKDGSGRSIPSSGELKREIWTLCYPDQPFDESSSLGDLFAAALRKRRADLVQLLQSRMTVNPDSLPDYYRLYYDFPWFRCYTLNVDDLESALTRRFSLQRPLVTLSATGGGSAESAGSGFSHRGLEVVHLNGIVPGPPESLTFSEGQYAERIGNQEPWYSRCVVDICSRPVIFIGTGLNESLLWQHMQLRKRRENLGRDLRPTSLLVTMDLPLPRQDVLRDLRIDWVRGTAEEFANEVLLHLKVEAKRGFAYIGQYPDARSAGFIPLVSTLASEHPNLQTEYLLGGEPQWSDILSGRAIERSHDEAVSTAADDILNGRVESTALALTGTAGCGKSTALMSLALKLSGQGIPVLWVDKESEVSPLTMRNRVRGAKERLVLAIDDADLYGRELVGLLRDLVPGSKEFLFVFATRSSKLDEISSRLAATGDVKVIEEVVPPLTDPDIDGLIAVLAKNNRLGVLTGASMSDRQKAFKEQAGRQLLVAMIQATSGENFEKKVLEEYEELDASQRYPYALISVATSLRYSLAKDEVLLALGDSANEALMALDRLTARHLIVPVPSRNEFRCRHRVIADLVFDKLLQLGDLGSVLEGLAWALASKVDANRDRRSRTPQFLARVINHEFLLRTIGVENARDLYTKLETMLSWDYHYWLQRGCLEVEKGDIRRSENFLGAARSLGSGDHRVETAYAYMLMRKAWESPHDLYAQEFLDTGIATLEDIIESNGKFSEYPFHVLGSQTLAWIHRSDWSRNQKFVMLDRVGKLVDQGLKFHPKSKNLLTLRDDIKRESLLTAVNHSNVPGMPLQ